MRARLFCSGFCRVAGIAAFLALGCGESDQVDDVDSDVLSGIPATDPTWNVVGALVEQDGSAQKAFCTATLIAPDRILTALHCIRDRELKDVQFAIGPNSAVPQKLIRLSEAVSIGGAFANAYAEGDISVVTLQESIHDVRPFPVRPLTPTFEGKPATVIGYGVSDSQTMAFGERKLGTSRIVSLNYNWEMEVGNGTDHAVCSGDSGSPLIFGTGAGRYVGGVAIRTSRGADGGCANPATYIWFGERYCDSGIEVGSTGCGGTSLLACQGGYPDGLVEKEIVNCKTLSPAHVCNPDNPSYGKCERSE